MQPSFSAMMRYPASRSQMKLHFALVVLAIVSLPAAYAQEASSVFDAIQASPQLSDLASIIAELQQAMGYQAFLTDAAIHQGGLTIFAPTNNAFRVLGPYSTCLSSYSRSGPMASSVVNNHIAMGAFPSSSLQDGQSLRTLANTNLLLALNSTGAFVNNQAAVVQPDFAIANDGVVHVIDRVMLPPGLSFPLFKVCSQTGTGLSG